MNQVLTYIPTNNITDLNELIYAGAKLVCEIIGIPSKNTKAKSKPGWEFRLEIQIENQRKQLKVVKQKKNAEINRKEKTTQKLTVQLEEIHQKVLAKEGRLKRYRQRVKQYRQNRTFHKNEKKFFINNWEGMTIKHINSRMRKKPNGSGQKYGNQNNIMKRLNG